MSRLHIHLHGQDNTCATYMTDAQKEQAEAPWSDTKTWPRKVSLAAFVVMIWAAFFGAVLS